MLLRLLLLVCVLGCSSRDEGLPWIAPAPGIAPALCVSPIETRRIPMPFDDVPSQSAPEHVWVASTATFDLVGVTRLRVTDAPSDRSRQSRLFAVHRSNGEILRLGTWDDDEVIEAMDASELGVSLVVQPLRGGRVTRVRWTDGAAAIVESTVEGTDIARPALFRVGVPDDRDVLFEITPQREEVGQIRVERWEWPEDGSPTITMLDRAEVVGVSGLHYRPHTARLGADGHAILLALTAREIDNENAILWLDPAAEHVTGVDLFRSPLLATYRAFVPFGDDTLGVITQPPHGSLIRVVPGEQTPWVELGEHIAFGATGTEQGAYFPSDAGAEEYFRLSRVRADRPEIEGASEPLFRSDSTWNVATAPSSGGIVVAAVPVSGVPWIDLHYFCVPRGLD